jgi:hypothetical protein
MSALNLLVFRGDRQRVSGYEAKSALAGQLAQLYGAYSRDSAISSLLRAGELECAIADSHIVSACLAERLTDRIAEALLRDEPKPNLSGIADDLRSISVPEQLSISTPEGFAFYGLHPFAYAEVVDKLPWPATSLLVVGIRSIGTTLSAVTAAAARIRGIEVQRLTVRPQGHPYNRRTELLPGHVAAVRRAVSCGALFAIVDEGPGLSGSSFLSVAEALERAGAPCEKIIVVSGHEPNVDALGAPDAARRWKRFRSIAASSDQRRPAQAVHFVGGGRWRRHLVGHEHDWPASWISFERLKYLSQAEHEEQRLFKFAGLGHYGDRVFEREQKVADGGFGPQPRKESDGFVSYPWVDANPMSAEKLPNHMLARLAEYCAFRVDSFALDLRDLSALQQMAEHNLQELGLDLPVELQLKRPVLADGRMQPHEWLRTREGQLLKTDSGSHGDDHFFPGPADIAWDLAGAIVEWQMNEEQTAAFLERYRQASGDDAKQRIRGFITAYAAFRCAFCMMAADAMGRSDEQQRLDRAAASYRGVLLEMEEHSLAASGPTLG